jgi:acetolactate synthase regulatory subunit
MRATRRFLTLCLLSLPLAAALSCRPKESGGVHLNGRIEAPLVDLAPKVAGRVLEVTIHEGDRVKAGDVLADYNRREFELTVDQARAAVHSADAQLRRMRDTLATLDADVARAQSQHEWAKSELERNQMLFKRELIAKSEPHTFGAAHRHQGDFAMKLGMPVYQGVNLLDVAGHRWQRADRRIVIGRHADRDDKSAGWRAGSACSRSGGSCSHRCGEQACRVWSMR